MDTLHSHTACEHWHSSYKHDEVPLALQWSPLARMNAAVPVACPPARRVRFLCLSAFLAVSLVGLGKEGRR